jgi:hypothetical protein
MKFKYILNPNWWDMNNRYSKRWDIELNRMIDQDNGVIDYFSDGVTYFTIKFGEIEVWVENYPYAYGTPNGTKGIPSNIRPSRETIERLKDYVESIEKKELQLNKY